MKIHCSQHGLGRDRCLALAGKNGNRIARRCPPVVDGECWRIFLPNTSAAPLPLRKNLTFLRRCRCQTDPESLLPSRSPPVNVLQDGFFFFGEAQLVCLLLLSTGRNDAFASFRAREVLSRAPLPPPSLASFLSYCLPFYRADASLSIGASFWRGDALRPALPLVQSSCARCVIERVQLKYLSKCNFPVGERFSDPGLFTANGTGTEGKVRVNPWAMKINFNLSDLRLPGSWFA